MLEAGAWGLLAASTLVVGALLSFTGWIHARPLRLATAFGAGVLISAVAYDLIEEAVKGSAGGVSIAVGFVLGSLVFYGLSTLVQKATSGKAEGTGILLGAALDGIPDRPSSACRCWRVAASAWPCSSPSLSRTCRRACRPRPGSMKAKRTRSWILGVWIGVAVVSGLVAALAYAALGNAVR